MNDLSLVGKEVKLVTFDKKYFGEIYKWYIDVDSNNLFLTQDSLLSKDELYNHLIDREYQILLFILPNNSDIPIGCIYSYDYKQNDGYIYTKIFLKEQYNKNIFIESCKLLYNYLFTCFPIRKIYYEEYEYNRDILEVLTNIDFKIECTQNKFKFAFGKYHDKYILGLYRENFYQGGQPNE